MAKIIRGYFIFTMVVASISILSYNTNFENYVLSVVHAGNRSGANAIVVPAKGLDLDMKIFSSKNQSPSLLNFKFINDAYKSFVAPGTEGAQLMGLYFKTGDEKVVFRSLKLKLEGVAPEYIKKAYLSDGKNILTAADNSGQYFSFSNINRVIDPHTSRTFYLLLDLSDDIHTGERLRMDLENPDDIVLFAGSERFNIDRYYPIIGKYLSIARVN